MSLRALIAAIPIRSPLPYIIAALVFTGAALAADSPTPVAAQTPVDVCPAPPALVDPENPRIIVASPTADAQVNSPVVISGEAGVFEANVVITIFNAEGEAIVETFTTALGAGPELYPFESDPIAFTVSETQPGCIWVAESSGDETVATQTVAIPVTLVAAGTGEFSIEPTPGGVTITTFTGTLAELQSAGVALNLVSCFATEGGQFIGVIFQAPVFVNVPFAAQFEAGFEDRPLVCRRA